MIKKRGLLSEKCFVVLMIIIILIAFGLRVICSFWGYPHNYYPDEPVVVEGAIAMLENKTWMVDVFHRPDHFEIKCDAAVFQLFSLLKYHVSANVAFAEHEIVFYLLARGVTVIFGIAMIPLSVALTGYLLKDADESAKRLSQILIAAFVAFMPVMVRNSSYATPDIVQAFFVMLFTYGGAIYLEEGSKKWLVIDMMIIGLAITIKYPSAILCIPLAGMVIYRVIIFDKQPMKIIYIGLLSIAVISATAFVLAPNLFTDFQSVWACLMEEKNGGYVGAENLGFFGNFLFYISIVIDDLGYLFIIPVIFGEIYLFTERRPCSLSLLFFLIYQICISVLQIRWERWGIPFYSLYIILAAIGLGMMPEMITKRIHRVDKSKMVCNICHKILIFLLMLNVVLSALCVTKFCTLKDIRTVASSELYDLGIDWHNTSFEAFNPYYTWLIRGQVRHFTLDDSGLHPNKESKGMDYLLVYESLKSSFNNRPDLYSNVIEYYKALDELCPVIRRYQSDGNYEHSPLLIKNIPDSIKYLFGRQNTSGYPIVIYDISGLE